MAPRGALVPLRPTGSPTPKTQQRQCGQQGPPRGAGRGVHGATLGFRFDRRGAAVACVRRGRGGDVGAAPRRRWPGFASRARRVEPGWRSRAIDGGGRHQRRLLFLVERRRRRPPAGRTEIQGLRRGLLGPHLGVVLAGRIAAVGSSASANRSGVRAPERPSAPLEAVWTAVGPEVAVFLGHVLHPPTIGAWSSSRSHH